MFAQLTDMTVLQAKRLDSAPPVRCRACMHGVQIRAFPEIVDCAKANRMLNADLDRQCRFFVRNFQ